MGDSFFYPVILAKASISLCHVVTGMTCPFWRDIEATIVLLDPDERLLCVISEIARILSAPILPGVFFIGYLTGIGQWVVHYFPFKQS